VLAIGDGALGFWGAIGDVFPETRHQRDWVHYAESRIMWRRAKNALSRADVSRRKSA
jgi:transposase-like protein